MAIIQGKKSQSSYFLFDGVKPQTSWLCDLECGDVIMSSSYVVSWPPDGERFSNILNDDNPADPIYWSGIKIKLVEPEDMALVINVVKSKEFVDVKLFISDEMWWIRHTNLNK